MKEWEAFLNGHWQKEIPQKEGLYPTAARNGDRAHDKVVYYFYDRYEPAPGPWSGWWWSEPFPELPNPGEWED